MMRNELVSRLQQASVRGPCGVMDPAAWDRVADECLRQMEWARSEGMKGGKHNLIIEDAPRLESMPGVPQVRVLGKKPLTLAPEDWKP